MGRTIFHFNQRLGFERNSKSDDNEAVEVKQSIAEVEMSLMEPFSILLVKKIGSEHL